MKIEIAKNLNHLCIPEEESLALVGKHDNVNRPRYRCEKDRKSQISGSRVKGDLFLQEILALSRRNAVELLANCGLNIYGNLHRGRGESKTSLTFRLIKSPHPTTATTLE